MPGYFWVVKKKQGFFGYCIFHQLKSTIDISAIYCFCGIFVLKFADAKIMRDFLGLAKKNRDILG